MTSKRDDGLKVTVRFLDDPSLCLWCWDISDRSGTVIEGSWSTHWTGFPSAAEALLHGLLRLRDLAGSPRGAVAARRNDPGRAPARIAIVARQEPALYEAVRRAFLGDAGVRVIRDRRVGERRRRPALVALDRRRRDRRSRPHVDAALRSRRWVVTHRSASGAPEIANTAVGAQLG